MKATTLLAAAVILFARSARADATPDDEKRVCFRAVDEAQRLHIAHKLVAAREQFLLCSRLACPVLFRNDCVGWLAEVQTALPSVVFGAKDFQGQDLIGVQVFVDGHRVRDKLEGTSSDVDPGPHVFRFEWEGHGAVEQQAVIREGEKDRLITVSFPEAPAREVARTAPHVPASVWLFGGLGVAGGVGFVALFLSTESQVNDMHATCAPSCPASRVDGARATYALSYVSLGVGIASVGLATTWFLLSRKAETVALSIAPTVGGGRASLVIAY